MKKLFYFFVFINFSNLLSAQDYRIIFKGVPIINITLLDNKTEADINRDTKFNATMSVINANGSAFIPSQLFTGNITIKGRGNSTWGYPKRPYNIVTCDSVFKKKNTPLFGMPTGSGWTLLADYEDRTAIKTLFTSAVSYALGLPWCSRALKIELYINGEYRGIYTFCEKVERDVNRINIKDLKTTDNSGDALTGGYTIERQFNFQIGANEVNFVDNLGGYWSYKVPDSDVITGQQNNYIRDYWNSFLDKVFSQPLSDTINGYRSVINPLSFAQYFLLQDISKNGEHWNASWYITKDRLKKMDAGPGWDWGLTWGAIKPYNLSDPTGGWIGYLPYYQKMLEDTFFTNLLKNTLNTAKMKLNQVIADGEVYYPQLIATGAIDRDLARWPNWQSLFPSDYYNNYPNYIDNLTNFFSFVKQRLYFEEKYFGVLPGKPFHTDLP